MAQWQQTLHIDMHLASQLIEKQTNIHVKTIFILGEGFDNIAYLINQTHVFRFPRRAIGIECIKNEINILPYIAQHIAFPCSFPEFIGKATKEYPAPFAGYRFLPGIPLCDTPPYLISDTAFAQTLATWLKQLHSIPLNLQHPALIKGDQIWRLNVSNRSQKITKMVTHYEHFFVDAGFTKKQLLAALKTFQKYTFDSVKNTSYCHGDLYSRHILIDTDMQPTGLIDWGDIHIGHPGTDLSVAYMIFSKEARHIFFETYGPLDETTHAIAHFRAFWNPIFLLPYCYEKKEKKLKNWVILALKHYFAYTYSTIDNNQPQ